MKYSILFLMIFTLFVGCSDDKGTNDDNDGNINDTVMTVADYFPVNLYATWTYSFFDSTGAPKRDAFGQPASGTFQVTDLVLNRNDTVFYNMEFFSDENPTSGGGCWLFSDSIKPVAITAESDPVVIYFSSAEVEKALEVSVSLTPPVTFDAPIFSPDSLTVTFSHVMDFQSYTDYTMTIIARVLLAGYLEEYEDTVTCYFRTTAPVFEVQPSEYTVCVTDEKAYKFYKSGLDFDLTNPDSCYIPLDSPLTVNHQWYDASYGYKILSIGPLAIGSNSFSNVLEVGQYWGSIGSDSGSFYYYAPDFGLVKVVSDNTTMLMDEFVP